VNRKKELWAVLVLAALGFWPGRGAPAAETAPRQEEKLYINLSGVTLESVIRYISDVTGKPVLLPDPFNGDTPVDIISSPRAGLPPEKQMRLFATALRSAGYSMVEHDDFIQIVAEGQADNVPLRKEPPAPGAPAERLVTSVVGVENADVTRMLPVLLNLKSRAGKVQAYPDANKLVITEYESNFQSMLALIHQLDREWTGSVVEIYKPRNTSADSLQNVITRYAQNLARGAEPAAQKRLESFSVFVHRPTNSLLLFGHPKDIAQARRLLKELDVKPSEAARTFHTYMVLNRDAAELGKVLDQVLAAEKARRETVPGAPRVEVIPDPPNNAIIVIATPDQYAQILPLIEQLDRPKAQVLIEAALVEMSMERLLDLGVEMATVDRPGERARGFGATSFGLSTITEEGRIPLPPPAGGLTAGIFKDEAFNIPALIRLSQSDDEISFIAAPRLMASEGKEAVVDISEKREFLKSIVSPEGRTSEVTSGGFHEAKIELKITPYVNQAGMVRLLIEQTTEQFLPSTQTPSGPLTNLTKRFAQTEVNVPEGRTVVIAGLTGTTQVTSVRKVPVLGHIPILGFFFRRKELTNQQRNLCVFITPRIMSSEESLTAEADRRRQEMKDLARRSVAGQRDEALDKVTGGAEPGAEDRSD